MCHVVLLCICMNSFDSYSPSLICDTFTKRIQANPMKNEDVNVHKMVPRGLEPRTLRLLAVRSDQLSYETSGFQVKNTQCKQINHH